MQAINVATIISRHPSTAQISARWDGGRGTATLLGAAKITDKTVDEYRITPGTGQLLRGAASSLASLATGEKVELLLSGKWTAYRVRSKTVDAVGSFAMIELEDA